LVIGWQKKNCPNIGFMTRIRNSLLIAIFSSLWWACNSLNEQQVLKLKVVDEVVFKANDLIPVNPSNMQYIEADSGNYLFAYNHVIKRYQFIHFGTGEVVQEVPIETEGPNRVTGITGWVLNQDSLWVIGQNPPSFNLLNYNGEVLKSRSFSNPKGPIPINYIILNSYNRFYQLGSKIFGPQTMLQGHHEISTTDLDQYQLVYSYELKEDTVVWYDVNYSADYWDAGKKLSDFSWTRRGNELVIAPFYDSEIQVMDMETGKVTLRKEAKSSKIDNYYYVNEIPWGKNEGIINSISHDKYGPVLFDPYREVFYRIFIPGHEMEEKLPQEALRLMDRSRPSAGVLIMDIDLNVIGEHLFETAQIHPTQNMFVGKEGLYLSMNNENHQDFDEDHFRYMVVLFE
jgi:hypothetical protein